MDYLRNLKKEKLKIFTTSCNAYGKDTILELFENLDEFHNSTKIISINIINSSTNMTLVKLKKNISSVLEINGDPNRTVLNIPFDTKKEYLLSFIHDLVKNIDIYNNERNGIEDDIDIEDISFNNNASLSTKFDIEYPYTYIISLIATQEYNKEKKKYDDNIDLSELEALMLKNNIQIIKNINEKNTRN